ncbi:MAG: right-handed parallel beta-helix repeat-containing protein [Candidatus Eisenbacteria sp.]|nr:right-handed parallel beta-helix repeat-containing protein [Candidatus Eisenbacteria bacterium]
MRSTTFTLIVLGLVLLATGPATARTWHVLPDGSGDAPTIAAAVDSCAAGDSVFISNGNYQETNIVLDKPLSIRGESTGAIVDGGGSGWIFHVKEAVCISNLTLRNAPCCIVQRWSPDVTWYASGIVVLNSGWGIFLDEYEDRVGTAYISNCTISDCGKGIGGDSANQIFVNNCIVTNCEYGFFTVDVNVFQVRCSDCWDNTVLVTGGGPFEFLEGNIFEDPLFCDPDNEDYHLRPCSPCLDAPDCGLIGALGLGDCMRVWHVPADAPTIQAGIDSALCGDSVLVACGTYYDCTHMTPDSFLTCVIMKSGICLSSETGEADCVTIDAQDEGRVIYCGNVDSTAIIEGFTLTRGYVSLPSHGGGAGMYCSESSPRLTNCTLRLNEAYGQDALGGGMFCRSSSCPILRNCVFSMNEATRHGGAMWCQQNSSPRLTNCVFSRNTACTGSGGGMYLSNSSPTLTNCTFALCCTTDPPDPGGAMYCRIGSSPTLQNTIIAFTRSASVAYCDGTSNATLTCCDVYGNEGGDWVGCFADQYGINGNISEDPLFCDPENDDYRLQPGSPCAPFSEPNPECDLIGALPVGCGAELFLSPANITTYYPCGRCYCFGLWVQDVFDLGAFEICTGYDNSLVQFEGAFVDSLPGSTGRTIYPLEPIPCDPSCHVVGTRYGAYSAGPEPGPTGSGKLARIYFSRLGDGAAEDFVCLENWELVDTQVPPGLIDVNNVSGATIAHRAFCYGDFNDDGDVTVQDIMQVSGRWGCCVGDACYSDTFDVNLVEPGIYCSSLEDGCIDVVDVQQVAARWGQGCPTADFPPPEPEPWSPTVKIEPRALAFVGDIGDTASFSLIVEDALDLGAFEATLSFDPSVVHVQDFVPGAVLGTTGRSVYTLGPRIDNEAGRVSFGAYTTGEPVGPAGPGTLARVILRMVSWDQTSPLDLVDVRVTDTYGWPTTPASVFGGSVATQGATSVPERETQLPTAYALYPGQPNPLNPSTTISFGIPQSASPSVPVELVIYNVSGQVVRPLVEREYIPGCHEVIWDGCQAAGQRVAPGIYFCRMEAGPYTETRRLVVVR